jgi:predicted nucleotidyltransferase
MYNKNILEELSKNISLEYKDYLGTYLFGSRAKGNSNDNSDYDIVVLFDSIDKNKKSFVYRIISEMEYRHNIFIDIKTLTPTQFKYNPFFYEEVIKDGILFR